MLVQLTYGRRAGELVDLPPRNAHALIADGRAAAYTAVVDVALPPGEYAQPNAPTTTNPDQVRLRRDRNVTSTAKRRRTR